ncbi:nucleotidyltransferase family protein [Paenibacillus sp. Marseille-Q4541]|uniref:nucleotidyltransferase family protein n=1 Tax=Paenibacillus sp. Marseille-Q4541 TaxID=2831522 RepID=UPI001BA757EA|nr:nucleotidyltransferase family protein [Paenibacillus sp. Marseille-Q4541]
MLTAGIILAAGQSRRMGKSKVDIPLKSVPLGSYAVNAALASDLDLVIVVVRLDDSLHWLKHLPSTERLVVIRCSNAHMGMSHSLRSGVKVAEDRKVDCVVILLADQPLVRMEHINTLLSVYSLSSTLHYVSAIDGNLDKPPLLLSNKIFSVICQLEGDIGARQIIRNRSYLGERIILDKEVFYDADTPEALEQISEHMETIESY